jgi:hypothetical protein
MSINATGELKLNFIVKWSCSEKELLEKCRSCETYSELMEVVYSNMIISVGGFADE